jgi:hypothetical protein
MYQAKSLGKNQVSGNPRPRRLVYSPDGDLAPPPAGASAASTATADEPAAAPLNAAAISVEPEPAVAAAAIPMGPIVAEPSAVPVEPATPVVEVAPAPVAVAAGAPPVSGEAADEDEADPSEVRRQIAAARRNMDPDHQIRRAMDAFLSPTRPNDPPN